MSARPLDLAELAARPMRVGNRGGLITPSIALYQDERDALIRYCRTARAALVSIGRDLDAHDADYGFRVGVARGACVRALRDLDAIAGEP